MPTDDALPRTARPTAPGPRPPSEGLPTGPRPPTGRRGRARAVALVAALAVVVTVAAGCSSDDGPDDAAATTTTTDDLLDQRGKTLGCASLPPGEPMTRAQAVVRLSPEQVCPGYVTVVAGTPVSFVNEGEATTTIIVTESGPDGSLGATLLDETIEPAATVEQPFDVPGTYAYSSDMIPSFRGTVEVQTDEDEGSSAGG